jgi:hypothetical protein
VFYVFLLVAAALGTAIYLIFIFQSVPGAAEERLGTLEPLPADLGQWKTDADSDEARAAREEGLVRELRTFFEEDKRRLVLQARYRDEKTGEIVRAEPDRTIKRRRRTQAS